MLRIYNFTNNINISNILAEKISRKDYYITSSLKIVAYEPELKSLTLISLVLALIVKSFSSDKTNLEAETKHVKL